MRGGIVQDGTRWRYPAKERGVHRERNSSSHAAGLAAGQEMLAGVDDADAPLAWGRRAERTRLHPHCTSRGDEMNVMGGFSKLSALCAGVMVLAAMPAWGQNYSDNYGRVQIFLLPKA
jgi:hypothetical protein